MRVAKVLVGKDVYENREVLSQKAMHGGNMTRVSTKERRKSWSCFGEARSGYGG